MELIDHQHSGTLIVLDGVGGVGKTTQTAELERRLRAAGRHVMVFSMPQYDTPPFGPLMKEYVAGAFGDPNTIHPKIASMLYAAERQQTLQSVRAYLQMGYTVICTRYVASNIAYQAAKVPLMERAAFIDWLCEAEYRHLQVPREDILIYLHAPIQVSTMQAEERAKKSGDATLGRDGHERDDAHLVEIQNIYMSLSDRLPLSMITCVDTSGMRSVLAIADDVWTVVQSALK